MGSPTVATATQYRSQRGGRRPLRLTSFRNVNDFMVGTQQTSWLPAAGDLVNLNGSFVEIMDRLQWDVAENGVTLAEADGQRYLAELRELGQSAYNAMLDGNAQQLIRAEEEGAASRGLSITLHTPPESAFFWEMLYPDSPPPTVLGPSSGPEDPDEYFWGFRYPMGRLYWYVSSDLDRIRFGDGVFSAVHDDLHHSAAEIRNLAAWVEDLGRERGRSLRLASLEQEVAADQLSVEWLVNRFNDAGFLFGIVHFACHCETPPPGREGASRAYLRLTARERELSLYLEQLLARQKRGFGRKPFVFLNACGTATPGFLLQTINFPTSILRFGAGGVIATACAVPDDFAGAFSAEFYRNLFPGSRRRSVAAATAEDGGPGEDAAGAEGYELVEIGEALLKTRLHFLREHNNPLGLVYGLYAVSNLTLALDD